MVQQCQQKPSDILHQVIQRLVLGGSRGGGGEGLLLAADIVEAKEEGSRVDIEDKDSCCCRPHKVPHLTNLPVCHNNRTPLLYPKVHTLSISQ